MSEGRETVDIRCPVGPRELFLRLRVEGLNINSDNLMEVHCRWCTRVSKKTDSSVVRVLHLFNFMSELVQSEIVRTE